MTMCVERIVAWATVAVVVAPVALRAQQQPSGAQEGQEAPYEVGKALPPQDSTRQMVSMTLQQALDRAQQANLDIQTARLTPEMQAYSLQAARAAYSPTFTSTYRYNNAANQSTSQLDGGARTTTQTHTFNMGIAQPVPWYGGNLSLDFNNNRTSTDNQFATLNPSYRSTVSLNYSQPLLAGFKTDNQRAALQTQDIQGDIAQVQLDSRVQNITDQVRAAYWGLRAAIEQIEIERRSVEQAQQLLADNQVRVRLGTMAQLQVIQAESQVATAQQALLNAQVQWRGQELAFKSLIISGPDDPLMNETINPTDLPTVAEQAVDIQAAVDNALQNRTDLEQLRQQRQIDQINLDVTSNNRLPNLSLSASYSLLGVGGDAYSRGGQLGGAPVLVSTGGYVDGLNSIAGFDTPTWNLGLNFSYPLGMKAAKANLERSRLQMQQQDLAIRSQELAVVTQVTNAGLNVRDTELQLEAARRSRELAEENAQTEVTRFNAGVATNYEVVTAQDDLTTARLSELRATINHINAIAEFDRVQRVGQ
jgi:outer membrane protein